MQGVDVYAKRLRKWLLCRSFCKQSSEKAQAAPAAHAQVHAEALDFERRRWGGRLPPLGPATPTATAALDAVELSDFHGQLAAFGSGGAAQLPGGAKGVGGALGTVNKSGEPPAAAEPVASPSASFEEAEDGSVASWGAYGPGAWPPGAPRRCAWRWRGALTDYCFAEPAAGSSKAGAPAILLCHGFGAFGDQWRGNLGPLAAAGYRVFAPTLPGFGRSEKAAIGYSQEAWRDYLRCVCCGVCVSVVCCVCCVQ